ncbi:pre-rRNA-processing protein TSR2 homolog [Daphnia carinata]|uniref:pre-rRNA-processing protein TSR2 homolog n=1 Tax=Daphnia carinata TaxID=120202 RepID=UPI00257CBB72|nr:pre-rRNA-processing protein TSR2 homolog [Daphnia carinata]
MDDNVLVQEVAEYMEDLMNNEFNTLCEDGSLEEMGESLCKYFQLIKDGKEEEVILELKKFKGSSVHLSKTASNHDSSTLKEDNDLEGSLQNQREDLDTSRKSTRNEPDEDGWVTVSKGKKH